MSESHDRELSDLARSLAALRPSTAGLDRDQLMYEAGRASARPRRPWLWPAACGGTAAVAACLLLALVFRPEPAPVVRLVERPAPVPQITPEPDDVPLPEVVANEAPRPLSPWRVQAEWLRHDLNELPVAAPEPSDRAAAPAAPVSAWDWRTRSAFVSSLIESE